MPLRLPVTVFDPPMLTYVALGMPLRSKLIFPLVVLVCRIPFIASDAVIIIVYVPALA